MYMHIHVYINEFIHTQMSTCTYTILYMYMNTGYE